MARRGLAEVFLPHVDGRAPCPVIVVVPYPSGMSSFQRPAPDIAKLIAALDEWERGEQTPGKVLANLKTAGIVEVLTELRDTGWTPRS